MDEVKGAAGLLAEPGQKLLELGKALGIVLAITTQIIAAASFLIELLALYNSFAPPATDFPEAGAKIRTKIRFSVPGTPGRDRPANIFTFPLTFPLLEGV